MGNRYVVKRLNFTPTAGNDVLTISSAASRRVRLVEVAVAGNGTSSAAQQIEISRATTTGSTSGGAVTATKFDHTDQPAVVATFNTTWTTQPVQDSSAEVVGWNALGGANRWIPPKGSGMEARNGEQISLRAAASGVTFQAMSFSAIVEED